MNAPLKESSSNCSAARSPFATVRDGSAHAPFGLDFQSLCREKLFGYGDTLTMAYERIIPFQSLCREKLFGYHCLIVARPCHLFISIAVPREAPLLLGKAGILDSQEVYLSIAQPRAAFLSPENWDNYGSEHGFFQSLKRERPSCHLAVLLDLIQDLLLLSVAPSQPTFLLRNRMGPGRLRAARLSIAQARAALWLRNYTGRTALVKLIGFQSLKRNYPLATKPQESRSAIVSRFQSLSRDRLSRLVARNPFATSACTPSWSCPSSPFNCSAARPPLCYVLPGMTADYTLDHFQSLSRERLFGYAAAAFRWALIAFFQSLKRKDCLPVPASVMPLG
jgi:hypothetical protein